MLSLCCQRSKRLGGLLGQGGRFKDGGEVELAMRVVQGRQK